MPLSIYKVAAQFTGKFAQQAQDQPEAWLKPGKTVYLSQGPLPQDYVPIIVESVRLIEQGRELVWIVQYHTPVNKNPKAISWRPGLFAQDI